MPEHSTRPDSVLWGRDGEALTRLLNMHAVPDPSILDVTHNAGVMWKETTYRPLRMDIDSSFPVDVAADFRATPFADATFDVIVFDPPHLPHAQDSATSCLGWQRQYGTDGAGFGRSGDNVSPLFAPFLMEAKRILVPDGIILAKIADYVHNHRYQWQHVDFVLAAREAGLTPCDLLIKRDPVAGNIKSGTWQLVHHFRRCHCYWFVVRNSKRCEKKACRGLSRH